MDIWVPTKQEIESMLSDLLAKLRWANQPIAVRNLSHLMLYLGKRFPIFRSVVGTTDYYFKNVDQWRPSEETLHQYDNDDGGGYVISEKLTRQELLNSDLRFRQTYDAVRAYLKENRVDVKKVAEVGCTSGDLLALLAEDFPEIEFVGIDFSVTVGKERYRHLKNITFIKGYVLEKMEEINADIMISISTVTVFLPKELDEFFMGLSKLNFRAIFISEPWWWGYKIDKNSTEVESICMKSVCWGHNYPAYLRKHGFEVSLLERAFQKRESERLFIVAERQHCKQGERGDQDPNNGGCLPPG